MAAEGATIISLAAQPVCTGRVDRLNAVIYLLRRAYVAVQPSKAINFHGGFYRWVLALFPDDQMADMRLLAAFVVTLSFIVLTVYMVSRTRNTSPRGHMATGNGLAVQFAASFEQMPL